ncbi:D-alanine--D-alanine ligase [Ancylobacter pratisalsi]|uniref:D-alanine--D-alanine ligase n=1 Tax=Ancylobacter pratisalsi TaxID=1745854 RepID=A0A6P1YL81_9HYPH|nr:D-alanine--D-alanine ligase [Ancylobacter pratisalsi]QIB33446.1 D-alanine--D-alanine ligase [Ancylobacter pratisalsi]
MAKHVAVLMGGWSAEREVSLRSGEACAKAAESVGYRVTRVDVGRDIAEVLRALKPDVALNTLHGRPGEDGTIQGILEVLQIPYTHSGVLASALAMDKAQAKIILASNGIQVPEGRVVTRAEAARAHVLPRPYVLKPVREGSSVGVFIIREDQEHPPQELHRTDWNLGDDLLAETYIPGLELTCAVMGDQALDVIEIQSDLRFYDYEAKYAPGGSRHILPAQILPNIYQKVRMLAVKAHRALGCRGISRSDFRYDDRTGDESGLVCLEVNTQPGMTETSLVPELAAYAGYSFGELIRWMVEDASLDR